MELINVLIVPREPLAEAYVEQVRAVSPRVQVQVVNTKTFTEVGPALANAEVLFTSLGVPPPQAAPQLRWVQAYSAGVDGWMRSAETWPKELVVTTASGIHTPVMAEYGLSMMLAWAHAMPQLAAYQAQHVWAAAHVMPTELRGATLGIVGYGSIGRETARLAKAFGMRILACKRNPAQKADAGWTLPGTGDPEGNLPEKYYDIEQLKDMLAECDYVVLALALTPTTRHLIDATALQSMKAGAVLVNVARGGLVDEPALVDALRSGQVRGAGLDVFEQEPLSPDSPLWSMPNVLLTPHISGSHPAHDARITALFTENLRRYIAGQPLFNQVDRAAGY